MCSCVISARISPAGAGCGSAGLPARPCACATPRFSTLSVQSIRPICVVRRRPIITRCAAIRRAKPTSLTSPITAFATSRSAGFQDGLRLTRSRESLRIPMRQSPQPSRCRMSSCKAFGSMRSGANARISSACRRTAHNAMSAWDGWATSRSFWMRPPSTWMSMRSFGASCWRCAPARHGMAPFRA